MKQTKNKTKQKNDNFILLPFKYMKMRIEVGIGELVLLALIGNLSQKFPCVATNKVLARFLFVDERTIQRYIKKLSDADYLISELNTKAKSGRTLIINKNKVESYCNEDDTIQSEDDSDSPFMGDNPVMSDNFVVEEKNETDEKDDNNDVGDMTTLPLGYDEIGISSKENDCDSNDSSHLIEKEIEKEIDNIIPTNVGTSADADGAAYAAQTKISIEDEMEKVECRDIYHWYHYSTLSKGVDHYYNKFKNIEPDRNVAEVKKSIAFIMDRKNKEFKASTSVKDEMENEGIQDILNKCFYYKEKNINIWKGEVVNSYYEKFKDIENDGCETDLKEIITEILERKLKEHEESNEG